MSVEKGDIELNRLIEFVFNIVMIRVELVKKGKFNKIKLPINKKEKELLQDILDDVRIHAFKRGKLFGKKEKLGLVKPDEEFN